MKTVLFPGSFDPLTNGHMDIIIRCASVFDKTIVAVANTYNRAYSFDLRTRVEILEKVIKFRNLNEIVDVCSFDGLLVNFLNKIDVRIIIRGIRSFSDFEYEYRNFRINKGLDSSIETLFFCSNIENEYISSSFVKELFMLGGDISPYVPEDIISYFNILLDEK